jgi:prophage regulatory protein
MPIKVIHKQRDVLAMLGISKSTLWRMIQKGQFPKPMKLSERLNGWRTEVIESWLLTKGGEAC